MTGRIVRWIIGLLILVLIGVRLSVFTVRQGEVALITRMGRARRVIKEPGCYSKWFWPFERAHHFDGRRRVFNPTFAETLTRSGETIIAESYVVWSIDRDRLLDFIKSFRGTKVEEKRVSQDAESHLNMVILDAQNAVLGVYNLTDLVSVDPEKLKLDRVEEDILREAQSKVNKVGIHVHQFGIKRLAFAEKTLEEALNQTRVIQIAKVNQWKGEGETKARAIHARTELEAAALVSEAKGIAEKTRLTGEAEAQRILTEAYQEDPDFYTFWRSLEGIKKIGTEQATLIFSTRSAFFNVFKQPTGPSGTPASASPSTQPVRSASGGGQP